MRENGKWAKWAVNQQINKLGGVAEGGRLPIMRIKCGCYGAGGDTDGRW